MNYFVGLIFVIVPLVSRSQSDESSLLHFEQRIDQAVVACDLPFLENAYASDFRFKHGTGLVDSKASWLNSVRESKGKFISRTIDSVEVELHGDIGVTNGRLMVRRLGAKGESRYMIKYVRIYRRKGESWEMIMHRTVFEKDNL